MQDRIGKVAGEVWLKLGEKGKATLDQLKKTIAEDRELIGMAVGWLAREGKVVVEAKSYGLTPEEKRIFEQSKRADAGALAAQVVSGGRRRAV